uniref:Uncharacterized protein n=1 Tax=Octopus bimaculoides TaxID=37653 RepID=A0A0L8FZE0_OCTBM
MKNGEIIGTRGSTGHSILIDARFELPYGKFMTAISKISSKKENVFVFSP